jgi:Tol biopolymer transport system component
VGDDAVKTASDPWGPPVNLGPTVNSSAWDSCPSISADGLSLFLESNRPGGIGDQDIWVTSRPTPDGDWGPPVNLGPTVNSSAWDSCPSISADGLSLYFCSYRPGGSGNCDLWVVTRATVSDLWGQPVNLGPRVNSSAWDSCPSISADGLRLFFFSNRPGGSGNDDLWMTTLASASDPWTEAVNLGPTVNSSVRDFAPEMSPDGCMLHFTSNRPGGVGGWDLYGVPIVPIVDFNGDGIVDAVDMCIMVDYWGTDEPLCDIGSMPWGDGIVDVNDLIILAEYLFTYPGAVAYWKLDETEGDLAQDSVGDNDGVMFGDAVWQPDGGQVDGALQFDGIDDYISTPFILNPADGEFSVFAWTKGGAPGEVIISQADCLNWLSADASEGNLMTELRYTRGRAEQPPLLSQTPITDGHWHRIGFVWDGSQRILYVDDVEVAADTQVGLEGSDGGLYIGAGKNLESGSFFSGLIDDVRIYNRAISP